MNHTLRNGTTFGGSCFGGGKFPNAFSCCCCCCCTLHESNVAVSHPCVHAAQSCNYPGPPWFLGENKIWQILLLKGPGLMIPVPRQLLWPEDCKHLRPLSQHDPLNSCCSSYRCLSAGNPSIQGFGYVQPAVSALFLPPFVSRSKNYRYHGSWR